MSDWRIHAQPYTARMLSEGPIERKQKRKALVWGCVAFVYDSIIIIWLVVRALA